MYSFSTSSSVAAADSESPSKKTSSKSKRRPKRSVPISGLNLSKTANSAVDGSFLLTDEGKDFGAFTAAEALNESTARNQYSDILVQLQAQNQGANVSLFYKQNGGVVATRGQGAHIFQDPQFSRTGNKAPFLDIANNVAGVGHSHPLVVQASVAEMTNIQTNARFLHPKRTAYVSKLLTTLPSTLDTFFFCNSGSEANDLALRIAKAYAKSKKRGGKPVPKFPDDVVVLDVAYHGHTQAVVDISPYKWRQCTDGENYHKEHIHVVSMPDTYRGPHRGHTEASGKKYAKEVAAVIKKLGGGVGAFIHESVMGCGGQIVMPPAYLQTVYDTVRRHGGIVIADEVQTGFARSGSHFWMFESYDVVPDIVTMGKPMGNGYPMAGVAVGREIANAFSDSGIEYFNTYAGNSVACAIGDAVLEAIELDKLQQNAFEIGKELRSRLLELQSRYPCMGDVRGVGLFLGVEFIKTDTGTEGADGNVASADILPNGELCKFVVDFLRYKRIIASRDGPDGNVLKIKPPLVFSQDNVNQLMTTLEEAISVAVKSGRF